MDIKKMWPVLLLAVGTLVSIGSYVWTHGHHSATPAAATQAAKTPTRQAGEEQASQSATATGARADSTLGQTSAHVKTLPPISLNMAAGDQAARSLMGTGRTILQSTFTVVHAVDVPIDLPAHVVSAQLRGTYQSFAAQTRRRSEQHTADVDFLVMSEKQFADFLDGRPAEAVFSVEDGSNQEVNFTLPPTFDHPAKYYLIFRNNSRAGENRAVKAEFRIDF